MSAPSVGAGSPADGRNTSQTNFSEKADSKNITCEATCARHAIVGCMACTNGESSNDEVEHGVIIEPSPADQHFARLCATTTGEPDLEPPSPLIAIAPVAGMAGVGEPDDDRRNPDLRQQDTIAAAAAAAAAAAFVGLSPTKKKNPRAPSPSLSVASAYSATSSSAAPNCSVPASLAPSVAPSFEDRCIELGTLSSRNAHQVEIACPIASAAAKGETDQHSCHASMPNAPLPQSSNAGSAQSVASSNAVSEAKVDEQAAERHAAARQHATRVQSSAARATMLWYSARLMANAKFNYILTFILAFPQLVVGIVLLALHGTLDTTTDCHYIATMWDIVYLCRLGFVLLVRTTIFVLILKQMITSEQAMNSPKLSWFHWLAWGFGAVWTLAGTAIFSNIKEECYEDGYTSNGQWIPATESAEIVHHTGVVFLVFAWIDVLFPLILGCVLVPMITLFTMTWLTLFSSWSANQNSSSTEQLRARIDSLPLVVYTKVADTQQEAQIDLQAVKVAPNEETAPDVGRNEQGQQKEQQSTRELAGNESAEAHDDGRDECAICIVAFDDGHICRVLPCGHIYHRDCIDCWLMINPVCCLCRRNVFEVPGSKQQSPSENAGATSARGHAQRRGSQRRKRSTQRSATSNNHAADQIRRTHSMSHMPTNGPSDATDVERTRVPSTVRASHVSHSAGASQVSVSVQRQPDSKVQAR